MKPRSTWRRVKLTLVREAGQPYRISDGKDVAELVRSFIREDPRENFVAVYLDTNHRPIAVHSVSVGECNSTLVHPREVFGPALQLAATAIVVAHNHPSGDPTPSASDRETTKRLRDVAELLGISFLDHVVLGTDRYYSFASEAFFQW